MGEIINLQLGTCGNLIGNKFWETILNEHELDSYGFGKNADAPHLPGVNVYFRRTKFRYVPRAILIDNDATNLKKLLSNCFRYLFYAKNFVYSNKCTKHNWAKGFYGKGSQLADKILALVQKEAEACDSMKGIQVVHGLGGGIGGGVGSLLAQRMVEEYPNKILTFYSVIPSRNTMKIAEVYNTVLTLRYLNNCVNETFCIDYDCICGTSRRNPKKCCYELVANCMSGITTCARFPCQSNIDLRKRLVNVVPYPQLRFFVPGYVETELKVSPGAVSSMTKEMFDNKNILINCNLANERFFTVGAIFRGQLSPKDVQEEMLQVQEKYKKNFVEHIPTNMQTSICDVDVPCCKKWSVTSLFNTSAIQWPFQALLNYFHQKVKRNYCLHWYMKEGMEKSEFFTARDTLRNILSQYREQ